MNNNDNEILNKNIIFQYSRYITKRSNGSLQGFFDYLLPQCVIDDQKFLERKENYYLRVSLNIDALIIDELKTVREMRMFEHYFIGNSFASQESIKKFNQKLAELIYLEVKNNSLINESVVDLLELIDLYINFKNQVSENLQKLIEQVILEKIKRLEITNEILCRRFNNLFTSLAENSFLKSAFKEKIIVFNKQIIDDKDTVDGLNLLYVSVISKINMVQEISEHFVKRITKAYEKELNENFTLENFYNLFNKIYFRSIFSEPQHESALGLAFGLIKSYESLKVFESKLNEYNFLNKKVIKKIVEQRFAEIDIKENTHLYNNNLIVWMLQYSSYEITVNLVNILISRTNNLEIIVDLNERYSEVTNDIKQKAFDLFSIKLKKANKPLHFKRLYKILDRMIDVNNLLFVNFGQMLSLNSSQTTFVLNEILWIKYKICKRLGVEYKEIYDQWYELLIKQINSAESVSRLEFVYKSLPDAEYILKEEIVKKIIILKNNY